MNLIEELEAASKRATPGPWTFVDDEYGIRIPEVRGECEGCTGWLSPAHEEDAAYIALCSPDNIQRLLKAHRVMSKALKWYCDQNHYNTECAPCLDKPSEENGFFPNEYDLGHMADMALFQVHELMREK